MADVFEDRDDLNLHRERLWNLIEQTPNLDWLLLTKRPEYIAHHSRWSGQDWPSNIWLGTTVENQEYVERRIPHLLEHQASVRFLSVEPMLGPVDLSEYLEWENPVNWVICGGESGGHSRPMNPDWVRNLRDQCVGYGVPFFFKQWGNWAPKEASGGNARVTLDGVTMTRFTKGIAGRELDGRNWDEFPDSDHGSLPEAANMVNSLHSFQS